MVDIKLHFEAMKPHLRAIKNCWLLWSAECRASTTNQNNQTETRLIAFIIGCGRSGTTLLGDVFAQHPQVNYLFEPYHLWAAIERRTDVLNLFHRVEGSLLMNASDYNEQSHRRFNCLIAGAGNRNPGKLVIEKTPLNALRIGYIEALAPGAKFVHIVRDGVDVCASIAKLASTNSYKIAGKPALNQWWGVDDAKWKALVRDGTAAGYYADEVHYLQNHLSRGAYEWLVSLREIDRWRAALGNRLTELTYDALTTNPQSYLKLLCGFFQIDASPSWIDAAASLIDSPRLHRGINLSLPPTMCEDFNRYQERYGFVNRATCMWKS